MNPASSIPPNTTYSLSWAFTVVRRLHDKHARATDFLCEALGIDLKDMAVFLAKKDPVWTQLRDSVKTIENWATGRHGVVRGMDYTPELKCVFKDYLHLKGWERVEKRLDKISNEQIIKEQGSRGDGGGA